MSVLDALEVRVLERRRVLEPVAEETVDPDVRQPDQGDREPLEPKHSRTVMRTPPERKRPAGEPVSVSQVKRPEEGRFMRGGGGGLTPVSAAAWPGRMPP